MLRSIFATSFMLATTTASLAGEPPSSLKGAVLGMSLAEFRRLPYPEGDKQADTVISKTTNYRTYCHDDPIQGDGRIGELFPSKAPAVRTCFHIADAFIGSSTPSVRLAPVGFAGLRASKSVGPIREVAYRFFPENGPNPRLIQIDATVASSSFEHLVSALTARHGKPSAVQRKPIQNGFGARFNNVTVAWQSGGYSVIATQFEDDLNTSSVRFIHMGLFADWDKAVKNTTPTAAKDF